MFYSQTFLARKGPLGTVWCAAHLQHRLKKSHYTSTDIKSVVACIMFPEVPIALRMSGHLLLGVSRIYSKKVDYLLHDCNVLMVGLKKALVATDINLAENDRAAAFDSVTLPQSFNLDDVEINYDSFSDGSPDRNLMSREEITLADQIPTGVDPFVAVTFDDDLSDDGSPSRQADDLGTIPGMDDTFPPFTSADDFDGNHESFVPSNQTEVLHTETETQLQDTGPPNQTEAGTSDHTNVHTEINESGQSNATINLGSKDTDNNDESSPDFGILRDAIHDSSPVRLPNLSPIREMDAPDDTSIRSEQDLLGKDITTNPIPKEPSSFQLPPHSEPPNSPPSGRDPPFSGSNSPPGESTPGLHVAASTPPVQQPEPPAQQLRLRGIKRKYFDEATVLTNKYIKKRLENCTDLLRKKRNAPSSSLDVWRQNKRLKKDRVFHEPLITGMSSVLSSFFEEGHDFVKHNAILHEEEDTMETQGRTSPVRDDVVTPENVVTPAPVVETVLEPTDGTQGRTSPVRDDVVTPEKVVTPSAPVVGTVIEPTDGNPSARDDMDIDSAEVIRNAESHHHDNDRPEIPDSPIQHSPIHRRDNDDSTPSPRNFQSTTETLATGHTAGSGNQQTVDDFTTSIGTYISGLMTPRTNNDDDNPFFAEDTQLSHILELRESPETEDHSPEADNTPAGSSRKSGKGGHQLSGRTRAVAQYLERQTPITLRMDDPSKEISLNQILLGKPRKLCARMFYETLVLKSHGVVEVEREAPQESIRLNFDVQQDEPYGDILLKLRRL